MLLVLRIKWQTVACRRSRLDAFPGHLRLAGGLRSPPLQISHRNSKQTANSLSGAVKINNTHEHQTGVLNTVEASHANDNTPDSLQPLAESSQEACSTCGSTVADKELRNRHQCNAAESSASASVYICECGFDFEDVNSMNEHRKSHGVDVQVKTLEAGTNNASKISNPSRHGSTSSSNNQSFDAVSRFDPAYRPIFKQFCTWHADVLEAQRGTRSNKSGSARSIRRTTSILGLICPTVTKIANQVGDGVARSLESGFFHKIC
ncbi:zinc finger protein 84-like [Arapaima gigas]